MRRLQQGFTLLELLVAMVVFAIMSTMAYSGLGIALSHSEQAQIQAERMAQLQKAFLIIGRDIEQAVNRPVRDNGGIPMDALIGSSVGSIVLQLSRTGRDNPLNLRRSNLQRIDYLLSEGKLVRVAWPVMDRSNNEPYEMALLDNVSSVKIQFLDESKSWQDQWPSLAASVSGNPFEMPRAIEVVVELEDWGRIRRVFEVVG